jgi:hypothetical protein
MCRHNMSLTLSMIEMWKQMKSIHLKCIKLYFNLFLFIDLPSLNHVTFGGGWPFTLHIKRTLRPSRTVKFDVMNSIEARFPKMKKKDNGSCINYYIWK